MRCLWFLCTYSYGADLLLLWTYCHGADLLLLWTWCRLVAFVEMFTWCMGDFEMWYGHVSPWLLSCVLYVLHIVVIMLSKYCQGAAENLNIFSTSNLNWNNCKLCQIYLSKYNCLIPKLGVKSQIGLTNRGKSEGHFCPFVQNLTPLGEDDGIGAKCCFVLKS